jgi:small GTP-binding protein
MNLFNKISKWIKMKFNNDDKDNEKDPNLIEYKILVLGERSVGKSSICMRFALNEFNLEIKPTVQPECYTKSIKLSGQNIKIYMIDIDEYVMNNDRNYLYSDAKGVLVVYDVTKSKTFDKVDNWITDFRQNSSMSIPIILVGNKCDLGFLKNVDYEEGLEKANSLNCEFVETSCVDLNSVKDALKLLIAKIYYNDLPETKKNYFKIYFSNLSNSNQGVSFTNFIENKCEENESEVVQENFSNTNIEEKKDN